MRAGLLRERVTVERLTGTADGGGGFTQAWASLGTVWASVEPVRAAERVEAALQRGVVAYRVTVRNAGAGSSAGTQDRLSWRGEVLNIRGAPTLPKATPYRVLEAESGVRT